MHGRYQIYYLPWSIMIYDWFSLFNFWKCFSSRKLQAKDQIFYQSQWCWKIVSPSLERKWVGTCMKLNELSMALLHDMIITPIGLTSLRVINSCWNCSESILVRGPSNLEAGGSEWPGSKMHPTVSDFDLNRPPDLTKILCKGCKCIVVISSIKEQPSWHVLAVD